MFVATLYKINSKLSFYFCSLGKKFEIIGNIQFPLSLFLSHSLHHHHHPPHTHTSSTIKYSVVEHIGILTFKSLCELWYKNSLDRFKEMFTLSLYSKILNTWPKRNIVKKRADFVELKHILQSTPIRRKILKSQWSIPLCIVYVTHITGWWISLHYWKSSGMTW